jgi:hypothetical protein
MEVNMEKRRVLSILFLLCGATLLLAQTTSYKPFPANETIQSSKWSQVPGCSCGIYEKAVEDFRRTMAVSPTTLTATVGQPVQIRYDASAICNGQGVRDVNGVDVSKPNFGGVGTVTWEAGSIQTLPNSYGIVTYSGYLQPKTDTIKFDIKVQCYDTGAKCKEAGHYQVCPASATIPVTIK